MKTFFNIGRYFFAGATVGAGLQQVATFKFVRLIPNLPGWVPWPSFWPCLIGVILVAIGGAIISGYQARRAALALCIMLVLTFLFQRIPEILANPRTGFIWTNPLKVLALLSGALALASITPREEVSREPKLGKWSVSVGPWLLGSFLLVGGVQHFVYAPFVDMLVPSWIPPNQRFWTDCAGVCLVAGGLGLFISRTRLVAASLSGCMIFLWVVLLHIPRVATEPDKAFEMAGVFEALALSGVAFLMAGRPREQEVPSSPA